MNYHKRNVVKVVSVVQVKNNMKLQLDTTNKEITIEESVNLHDLYETLNDLLPLLPHQVQIHTGFGTQQPVIERN